MGLDLGALLRGGAGISSGYQQGQQERAERERAAQQRALQDALLRARTDNQQSLQDDRRIRQEGNAASALRQQGVDETTATEAERQRLRQVAADALAQRTADRDDRRETRLGQPTGAETEPKKFTLQDMLKQVNTEQDWMDELYPIRLKEARRRLRLTNDPSAQPQSFRAGGFGSESTFPGGANFPARPVDSPPTPPTQPTTFSRNNPYVRP